MPSPKLKIKQKKRRNKRNEIIVAKQMQRRKIEQREMVAAQLQEKRRLQNYNPL
jgi:hypothetical protein